MTDYWIIKEHNDALERYYNLIADLNIAGIVIREIPSVGDSLSPRVVATTLEKEKTGDPWVFGAENWFKFYYKAKLFLLGYNLGRNQDIDHD